MQLRVATLTMLTTFLGHAWTSPLPVPSNTTQPHKRAWTCWTDRLAKVEDVKVCIDYLRELGDRECFARGDQPGTLCAHGSAIIQGKSATPLYARSDCFDVGRGAEKIMKDCEQNGLIGGIGFVYGNGDYAIQVEGVIRGRNGDKGEPWARPLPALPFIEYED